MSNRKRSTPNIPAETLERARAQARGEEPQSTPKPAARVSASERREASTRRPRPENLQVSSAAPSRKHKNDPLDQAGIKHLLTHPTKLVTEAQLHEEYGYVLRDVRNMLTLAAGLMVALVILAQFI